jgi:hypothetical protein
MISEYFDLKKIRFEVNPLYVGKELYIKEWEKPTFALTVNQRTKQKGLKLRIKISHIDPVKKDEVFGYTSERIAMLIPTNIKDDREVLIWFIKDTYTLIDRYINENASITLKNDNGHVNADELADEIFIYLIQEDLY